MRRWIANAAVLLRTHSHLAGEALLASRSSTMLSVALIATSVLLVVGAERAFAGLASVVSRLADGGATYRAIIDINRCAHCARMRASSALLQQLVHVTSTTTIAVHRIGSSSIRRRRIPVRCVSPERAVAGVSWASLSARRAWAEPSGTPVVLLGADLAPVRHSGSADTLVYTSAGVWRVGGVMHARSLLADNAGENAAIVVPWQAPFRELCDRGRAQWTAVANDSVALRHRVSQVVDELRTQHGLRPAQSLPWYVGTSDQFAVLVVRIVARFRLWILAVPLTIALLCGAGIFSVQALASAARVHEFGVRRAVGATQRALLGQLLLESLLVGAAGIAVAGGCLAAAGLLGTEGADSWKLLPLAAVVALPLCAIGLLLPGLSALRASSIAGLEGRGDQ
ncbi:FtsX-like permease family protein [Gemmatimonas sp.]